MMVQQHQTRLFPAIVRKEILVHPFQRHQNCSSVQLEFKEQTRVVFFDILCAQARETAHMSPPMP